MSVEQEQTNTVDAHYAYFRALYDQLSESPVGVKVRNIYDYTKQSSPYVQKTLDGVEGKVSAVNEQVIAPLYASYGYPTAEKLVQASQSGLDKSKVAIASVKDLAQAGTTLGLGVAVVGAQVSLIISATLTNLILDGVILSKDAGTSLINKSLAIEKQVESSLLATVEHCKVIAGVSGGTCDKDLRVQVPINKAAEYTNSVLDIMNAFLDNFLHLPVDESENPDSTIPQRVKHLTSRVGQAILSRTVEPAQRQVTHLLENLRQRLTLIDAIKKHGESVKEQVLNNSLSELYVKIEKEAIELRTDPGDALLRSIQNCAKTLDANLKNIKEKSSQTLPQGLTERLEAAINYIQHLDNTFGSATSIHAIKDEVVEEAKLKISEIIHITKLTTLIGAEQLDVSSSAEVDNSDEVEVQESQSEDVKSEASN